MSYKGNGKTTALTDEQTTDETEANGNEKTASSVNISSKMQEAKEMTLKAILTQEAIDRSNRFAF